MAKFNETVKVKMTDRSVIEVKATSKDLTCLGIVKGKFTKLTRKPKARYYQVA